MTSSKDSLKLAHRSGPATCDPLLTIVVCAYRHSAYVHECLASVACVAGPDVELLVIDDGSPDDTLSQCMEFPFDQRLPVQVFTKANAGLVDSLNQGLRLARGRFVAFIASDDAYEARGLEDVISGIRDGTWTADATMCQAVHFGDVQGTSVYGETMRALFECTAAERHRALCLQFPRPMLLQATVFRTAFLRELAPWNGDFELDDWPTFIRVFESEAAGRGLVRYLPELCLTRYRIHGGGIHHQLARQLRVTEQVARNLVPAALRRRCLANVRIDIGLIHLYERRIATGLALCVRGFLTCPSPSIAARVTRRGSQFVRKRMARKSRAVAGRQ